MPLDPTLDELASQQPWLPPAVSNFNEQASGVAGGIGKAALGAVKDFNDRLGSVMSTPPEQLKKRDMDPHRTMRQMRNPVDESDIIMPPP